MADVLRFCDELGPGKVLHIYVPRPGLRAILVVDNVAAGPAIGGARMAEDVSLEECFRLARAMTLKNAAAGLPHGGGKAVIFGDSKQLVDQKEQLVRAFACAIDPIADYIPGPDMGTDETCMGLDQGRNRPCGRAAGRTGRHPAGQDRRHRLRSRGLRRNAASDTTGAVIDPDGIDAEELVAIKDEGGRVRDYPRPAP